MTLTDKTAATLREVLFVSDYQHRTTTAREVTEFYYGATSLRSVRRHLRDLRAMGYVTAEDVEIGTLAEYRVTDEGRRALISFDFDGGEG